MNKNIIQEQLIRDINRAKEKHDKLKEEISGLLYEMVELEKKINQKIVELGEVEKKYVELIELYTK